MQLSRTTMRGEVSVPLVTVIGLGTTVLLGFVGFVMSTTSSLGGQIDKVEDVNIAQGERITIAETKLDRVPYLEAKVDRLLEKEGIDPKKVLPAAVIQSIPTSTPGVMQSTMPK